MHIAIAGNIGSGKTTLTKMLAKQFNWIAELEEIDDNPYLTSFYEDMQRWSFNLQVFFLNIRLRQVVEIQKKKKPVIQDRTIFEDACIFAPNLRDMGLMASRDFDNYMSLFDLVSSFVQPPDLLIYLRASTSTLVSQIQKRGRKYESSIRLDYLQSLNDRYEQWAASYNQGKILVIDVDTCKFFDNKADFGEVVNKVNAELFGLFNK